jgi:hypothetical protein
MALLLERIKFKIGSANYYSWLELSLSFVYKNEKKQLIDLFHPRLGYSTLKLFGAMPPLTAPPQIPPAVLVQQKQGTATMVWAIGAFVNSL